MNIIVRFRESLSRKIMTPYCRWRDFRTDRHIVVFESDDWGSIRMSNKKDWDELLRMGYAVDKRPYERFDTLESVEDLDSLFEVLNKYKDINGNHPVITANMLMANPDFERIEKSGFQEYFYEPVTKTYDRYYGNTKVLELMRHGIEQGVFMPQSHGREHFNVSRFLKGLQRGDQDIMTAFNYGMCGIAPKTHPEYGNQLMNALLATNQQEQDEINKGVQEGLKMFEQQWGFKSRTFVAPCYLWNKQIENVLVDECVELIQTSHASKASYNCFPRHFYSGQHNSNGLIYSVRNCKFEPATKEGGSTVESLMAQIEGTFVQRKIAVFSTHRINYVSGIDSENRKRTLSLLDKFLTKLIEKYSDIEFLSSDKLIDVLRK